MPGFTINSIKIPLGNILNTTLKDIIQVRQKRPIKLESIFV